MEQNLFHLAVEFGESSAPRVERPCACAGPETGAKCIPGCDDNEFYVVSLKHSHKRNRYITFWCPDDRGYCYRLPNAGKYRREIVMAHLGYYNTGYADIAVRRSVVEAITTMTTPADMLDGPDGPAVLNTPAKWRKLMTGVIETPRDQMKPAVIYFGRNAA